MAAARAAAVARVHVTRHVLLGGIRSEYLIDVAHLAARAAFFFTIEMDKAFGTIGQSAPVFRLIANEICHQHCMARHNIAERPACNGADV